MLRFKALIKEILETLESSEKSALTIEELTKAVGDEAAPAGAIYYHVLLSVDRGYIVEGPFEKEYRLTWAGHEALEEAKTTTDNLKTWAKLAQ